MQFIDLISIIHYNSISSIENNDIVSSDVISTASTKKPNHILIVSDINNDVDYRDIPFVSDINFNSKSSSC